MNLLALDTATEQCSVAIVTTSKTWQRSVATARGHADLILTMIDALLLESGLHKKELQALAFGRGPGSFTGVRIAVSVAQGLSFALKIPVVGISTLAAVAQRIVNDNQATAGSRVLVCMDARMQEVYWGIYKVDAHRQVAICGEEQVTAPINVQCDLNDIQFAAGTGLRAYPALRERFVTLILDDNALPRALEIAQLAFPEIAAGHGLQAAEAQPVYLRDQVVSVAKI